MASPPIKKIALPYVPAHEIVLPEEYTFFDRSRIFEEQFVTAGKIDFGLLRAVLFKIRSQYIQNQYDPGSDEYHDNNIAFAIEMKIREAKTRGEKVPSTVPEFRAFIGEDLFNRFQVMLHIREEEYYFEQTLAPAPDRQIDSHLGQSFFGHLKKRLEKYGVTPENITSFKKGLDENLFRRFEKLVMFTTSRGLAENRQQVALRFLQKFVTYKKGDYIYKIAKNFRSDFRNPQKVYDSMDIPKPEDVRTWNGHMLYCGLIKFLENDIAGQHWLGEPVLNNVKETGRYSFELPDKLSINEGDSVVLRDVFQTNIRGAEHMVSVDLEKPDGAEGRIFAKFDPDTNQIKIKAARNYDNHDQYEVKVRVNFDITNLDLQHLGYQPRKTSEIKVSIVNEDEPPTFIVEAPRNVEEGGLFCMNIEDLKDPEGDEIDFQWSQLAGPKAELTMHGGGRKICAQAEPTNELEDPFQFRIAATSILDIKEHPFIKPRTSEKQVMVLNIPNIKLATGEWVKLPAHIVNDLTNPEKRDTAAIVFATSRFLYILLRLPTDISAFHYDLKAPVADKLNVIGCDGRIHDRRWKPFSKVPGNVLAYQSTSPLRRWVKPGTYQYKDVASVSLESLTDPIWTFVPVEGEADVLEGANATQIIMGDIVRVSPTTLHIPFRITNAQIDGKDMLKLPEELEVHLSVRGESEIGKLRMTKTTRARRQKQQGLDALYYIEIPLHKDYSINGGEVKFNLSVENNYGELADLKVSRKFSNGEPSLFDSMKLSTMDTMMPFPYALLYIDVDKRFRRWLPFIAQSYNDFLLHPDGTRGNRKGKCASLQSDYRWNRVDPSHPRVKIPLGISNYYDQRMVKTFISNGGTISGKSRFKLPAETAQGESAGNWDVFIDWKNSLRLASTSMPKYPDGIDMMKIPRRKRVAQNCPLVPYKWGGPTVKEELRAREIQRKKLEHRRELEKQGELKCQKQFERQQELKRKRRELARRRELERQKKMELARLKKLAQLRDPEYQKKLARQKELKRRRVERQGKLARQREIERQKARDVARQKEIARQKGPEYQKKLERQREIERQRAEQRRKLAKQRKLERQKELERQRKLERQRAKRKKVYRANLAELQRMLQGVTLQPVQNEVRAGQEFYLELRLPEKAGAYAVRHIHYPKSVLGRRFQVKLSDRSRKSLATYRIGSTGAEVVGHNTLRLTFKAPGFLPPFTYDAALIVDQAAKIGATYTISYSIPEDNKKYEKDVTLDIVTPETRRLDNFTVYGANIEGEFKGEGGYVE